MLLYLVRHGDAVSKNVNADRPLSKKGRLEVTKAADHLAANIRLLPRYLYHSSKTRAAETASIFAQILPGAPSPKKHSGLLPMDDPAIWAKTINRMDRDVMLVGHLPHLSRLSSLLLAWDPGKDLVEFNTGTVVCLEKTRDWHLKWMLSPQILR